MHGLMQMIIYKICLKCSTHVEPCHEVCPLCGGTVVGVEK
jgi:RNA polymerase subunit RPABC4/transcription elongation factor Spt4